MKKWAHFELLEGGMESTFKVDKSVEVRRILESMEKRQERVERLMESQPFRWATRQTPNLTPKQIAYQLYHDIWE